LSVALSRGEVIGYDAEKMVFRFTMLESATIVDCQISGAALDNFVRAKGAKPADRQAQFAEHRQAIEELATRLYVTQPRGAKLVRIFFKHIRK
jgi:hypothetical protein